MCRCRYDVTSGRATRYPPIRTCSEEITVFAQRIGDPYSILPGGRERGKETGRSIILLTIARDFSRSIDKGNVVYRDFRKCLVSPLVPLRDHRGETRRLCEDNRISLLTQHSGSRLGVFQHSTDKILSISNGYIYSPFCILHIKKIIMI